MRNLGNLYENGGNGVPQDYDKARQWYEKAFAAGDAPSAASLGLLYDNGQGVPQDYAKALEWFEKGAAGDDAFAMRDLGVFYENGRGVPQDYDKAREWYEKAFAKGDAVGARAVGLLYYNGSGVPQDYAKAREWFEKGAAGGDALAMRNLGVVYANGQGVPKDEVKAREWYEKAAAAGDADATKAKRQLDWNAIEEARRAGRYADALSLAESLERATEADDIKSAGKLGPETAREFGDVSWNAIFAQQFSRALVAAEQAHLLDPDLLWLETNHAHALMFLNRTDEARALYLSHKDEPVNGNRTWRQAIAADFVEFRKVGLVNPLMEEIEPALIGKTP
jgi:TPR repeat protein